MKLTPEILLIDIFCLSLELDRSGSCPADKGNQNSLPILFCSGFINKLVMKLIKLTQGKFTQVDDDIFDYLNQWKWQAHLDHGNWYATRAEYKPKKRTIFMHRLIMNTPAGLKTDHKDRNGLNNQRANLRNATCSQNSMNQKPHNKSGYIGVYYHKTTNNFQSSIRVNKKNISLGYFNDPISAAKARDIASKKYFGEFAYLNFN
jgi:hypothetical protein